MLGCRSLPVRDDKVELPVVHFSLNITRHFSRDWVPVDKVNFPEGLGSDVRSSRILHHHFCIPKPSNPPQIVLLRSLPIVTSLTKASHRFPPHIKYILTVNSMSTVFPPERFSLSAQTSVPLLLSGSVVVTNWSSSMV